MIAHAAQAFIALMLWLVAFAAFGGVFNIGPKHKVPQRSIRITARIILGVVTVFFAYGAWMLTQMALGN